MSTAQERRGGPWWPAALVLAALVLWAPLPFASTPDWAQTVLWSGAALSLPLALLARDLTGLRALALPASALAGVGGLGLLQSLPLPASWVALVVPLRGEVIAAAGEAGPAGSRATLALAPELARGHGLGWLAAACLFAAAAIVGRERGGRRLLAGAVLASAFVQVIYGAQLWFERADTIWGVAVPSPPDRLHGSFVNPDHLASWLELALAVALAVAWLALRRARQTDSHEQRLLLLAPILLLWATLFVGLAFTGSRAGLLAGVTSALAMGAAYARAHRRLYGALAAVVAAAGGLALVSTLGHREGFGRFAVPLGESLAGRFEVLVATLELWAGAPLAGVGLGGFRHAFPLVRPEGVGGLWRHAHADWAELLATGGLVGGALVAVAVAGVGRRHWRLLARGERAEERAAGLAGLGALVALGVHSCFDFGLAIPANAALAVVVLGATAAPSPRAPGGRPVARARRSRRRSTRFERAVIDAADPAVVREPSARSD